MTLNIVHITGSLGYKISVSHYLESSSDVAIAAVQPGTPQDVAAILKVIADNGVDFAIKGGGHNTNPGFSSTKGIQICMMRIINKSFDSTNGQLTIGAGCLFDEVYRYVEQFNVNVVGGSATAGVGVAGYLLGGGYSLKTNQYGLGMDNIVAMEVALPDGTLQYVDAIGNNTALFEVVKGGGSNFGIVTQFVLQTHTQLLLHTGTYNYDNEAVVPQVIDAMMSFIDSNKDPKATFEGFFQYSATNTGPLFTISVQWLYDGPVMPNPNPFQPFQDIPGVKEWSDPAHTPKNATHKMSYLEYEERFSMRHDQYKFTKHIIDLEKRGSEDTPHAPSSSGMTGVGEAGRGLWGNAMLSNYNAKIINALHQLVKDASGLLAAHGGISIATDVWPFLPSMFDDATPSAWPHFKGKPNSFALVKFLWEGSQNDSFWHSQMKMATTNLQNVINDTHLVLPNPPYYLNTADAYVIKTEEVYRDNLPNLSVMKRQFDPKDVMRKAGSRGFRIPI
ncbi:hypothetical protein M422DRAFT_266198 [Sphaerobolus stellatus SS14]|uniref:FAD-binding PCMH-type domain-containing protein n=1 Tax=Sphaerobolus stellatus (strain SS14) TaxID=990650 RepID=A0A0C9TPS7_SPHS4|nr:hypothetical protein M422DRAFT_266198 [Sphaerobolus stellatus SS14]